MALKTRWIEDAARLAGGTVSVLSNVHAQIRQDIRTYIDDMATRLDYVPREDFERLEAQLADLSGRIAKLEEKKSAQSKPNSKPKTKIRRAKKS